ncbi:hypothetical protein [Tichowtungia aerotolerans]|uniref:Uncharacterized protein n=1 Tax=Tichowtungia aerotolerans TaxID=2697043 RepID=A0A6P1MDW9_9BACT|nr:hypothetical protein [Tichowtungia aerotolerans]QHI69786.1 hypothetical protein GT409_10105 [Tichowtungia aerotolerans]
MRRNRSAVVVFLVVAGLGRAATWTGAATEWLSTAAWDTANIPNSVGEYAEFGDSSEYHVNIGSTVIVGRSVASSVKVSGTGSYTFGGAGTLRVERTATSTFANDMYFSTTGDTVFNVPVISTRSTAGTIANRFRAHAGCGDVIFNQPLSWSNTSLQLLHDSSAGSIQINGGMMAEINKELWIWTSQPAGISINSTISSSVSGVRITVASGNGTVRFSNPSGVAVDSSIAVVAVNGGAVELGGNNQIDTKTEMAANGGMLDMNGYSNRNATTLGLSSTTDEKTLTIDFSDAAAEALYFEDCSSQTWADGNLLDLVGFEFGVDELRFGTGSSGLTAEQLGQIRVDGAVVENLGLDSIGALVIKNPILATWTGFTSTWESAGAWNTATFPYAIGDGVVFGDSAQYSVEIGTSIVLGRTSGTTFKVQGSGSYTFGGAGTLKIERGATDSFANDVYFTTSGDTVFNVPVISARSTAGTIPNRFRANAGSGNVIFNQPLVWSDNSLQLVQDSSNGSMQINGGMVADTSRELWIWTSRSAGVSLNSTISSSVLSPPRITLGGGGGTVRFSNPSGVAVDSSMDRVAFNGGVAELGGDNQIATKIGLSNSSGMLDMNGYSNLNTTTLELASTTGDKTLTIDFSNAFAEALYFDDCRAQTWADGNLLNLVGFEFGVDELRFGPDANGLTADQLSRIRVDGNEIVGLALDSNGFLVKSSVCIFVCQADGSVTSTNTKI